MISLINAQRKLTDTEQRMIDDEDFFDVTSAQIRALCAKLLQMGYPLKEVQRIRTKYWDYFTDKEKEVMQELGLNYDEQAISKRGDTLLINGFTVRQWKMLTADDYFPPPATIQKFMNLCLANGDKDSFQVLLEKYQTYFAERKETSEAAILSAHGLPPNTPYKTISNTRIDGLSFYTWKLVNLKGYVPSNKSVLVSKWRQFERSGDYEIAAKLEEKYFDLLHPEPSPPTEDAIFKAEELFLNSFPNNAALKKRIDADRARRKRKAEGKN